MYCWICDNEVAEFQTYGIPARPGRCPHCGAKPRSRLLGWVLKQVLCPRLPAGAQVLEAGASKFSVDHLLVPEYLGLHRCIVIDLRRLRHHLRLKVPHMFVQMDLTLMGFTSASFDLILCNNTLPYVSDDYRAIGEIRRCLKPGGVAILNTHREPGPTVSVSEHRRLHPELDDEYYAVNGDQRVYGDDFFHRVSEAGLESATASVFVQQSDQFLASHGLKRRNEMIFACVDRTALEHFRHAEIEIHWK